MSKIGAAAERERAEGAGLLAHSLDILGGPFDAVFDVGGNIGLFAQAAHAAWPQARLYSFEPIPAAAERNLSLAAGRWTVYMLALSDAVRMRRLYVNGEQHLASSMQSYGGARRRHFGYRDRSLKEIEVECAPLDMLTPYLGERSLLKIDVEGHEGEVLAGGRVFLADARLQTVVVEVQNDRDIFRGSPSPGEVDAVLSAAGLAYAGLGGCLLAPSGRVMQYDAVYRREGGEQ